MGIDLDTGSSQGWEGLFRYHALKELRAENFSIGDAIHCILIGEIVENQIDRNGI